MGISSSCPENIVLIGFMGSGKSTVGRLLARRSGRYFLDADALIESQQGRPIPEIFAKEGEGFFRALERESAEWMAECVRGTVISTGGGMPIVTKRLRDIGRVVYLKIAFEKILERIPHSELQKRPLFSERKSAEALFMEREKIYGELAEIVVDASAPPEAVAEEILRKIA
ncbi:shikimate kinase I [Hydrogenimonas sp.]|nr:shikimate kinase I [Hydrogenimonas sp.]